MKQLHLEQLDLLPKEVLISIDNALSYLIKYLNISTFTFYKNIRYSEEFEKLIRRPGKAPKILLSDLEDFIKKVQKGLIKIS